MERHTLISLHIKPKLYMKTFLIIYLHRNNNCIHLGTLQIFNKYTFKNMSVCYCLFLKLSLKKHYGFFLKSYLALFHFAPTFRTSPYFAKICLNFGSGNFFFPSLSSSLDEIYSFFSFTVLIKNCFTSQLPVHGHIATKLLPFPPLFLNKFMSSY